MRPCPFDCRGQAFIDPETAYGYFCTNGHVWTENDPEEEQ